MLRGAGIVAALIVLAACNESSPVVRVSPSPPPAAATWTQDLSFSGEITGHMTSIVPSTASLQSACTGAKPRPGQTWADESYGSIDTSGAVWGIDFVIQNYGGPGGCQGQAIGIQVHDADSGKVGLSMTGDTVAFTLDRAQQSGTVDATLTNADSGKAGSLHLSGRWNCKA